MLGSDDAIQRVLDDEFDFAIVVLPVVDSRLEVEPLLREDVLLVVPPEHSWAGRPSVRMAEALADPALLLSMPGLGLRAMVDAAARDGGGPLRANLEMRSQAILARGFGRRDRLRAAHERRGARRPGSDTDRTGPDARNRLDPPARPAPSPDCCGTARGAYERAVLQPLTRPPTVPAPSSSAREGAR